METITKDPVKDTFEVLSPEAPAKPAAPTRDELKASGWSADELARAEKRGLISNPEDDEAKKKAEADAKAKADAEASKPPVDKPDEDPPVVEERRKGSLPDFTFKTPEQEKAWLDAFGPGTEQRAIYFRMKNERSARQSEKARADAAEARAKAAEDRVAALVKEKPAEVLDENGEPIDPEDRPLTLKELKALQKQEAEESQKKNNELQARATRVAEAQTTQEEYARTLYPDFDDTMAKVQDVLKNLDKLVPEKHRQAQVVDLVKKLQVAAANADSIDLDDLHAAMIAYEIGKFHPEYGKKAETHDEEDSTHGDASDTNGKSDDPKKANGGRLTPEQMKRIAANTQRKASSASVKGGGGKRTIEADDVDLPALNAMSYGERQKFRQKHPERYTKLLRG